MESENSGGLLSETTDRSEEAPNYNDLDDSDEGSNDDAIVDLIDGINLSELSAGTTFQIKPDSRKSNADYENMFENEEILKYVRFDCMDVCSDDEEGRSDVLADTPFERIALKMKNVTEDGSVKKRVIRKGDKGKIVPKGSLITMHYNAYLEYGDEPFDSTNLRGGPQKYRLGAGNLLPGLEIAVETMCRNEVSQFLVEPHLAWGKFGCPPRIPPDATALFEVTLIDFVDSGGIVKFESLTFEEQKNAEFADVLNAAKGLHLQGNELFRKGSSIVATKRYKKAISLLENCSSVKDAAEESQQNLLLVKLYVNLAVAYNRMKQPAPACTYTKLALALSPGNVKALFNRGKALLMLNDFKESGYFLRAAQKQCPGNEDINRELKRLEEKQIAYSERERDMYRNMFSEHQTEGSKVTEEKRTKAKILVSDKFSSMVREDLNEFKNSDGKAQFNLPSGLTAAEEEFIRTEASALDLKVISHGEKLSITK